MMKNKLRLQIVPMLFISVILTACGGGSDGASDKSISGGSTNTSSSSGSSCIYEDKITQKERQEASACGIQVSDNYGQADSGLAQVIAACQKGEKTTADNYYKTTYQTMVNYAKANSKALSCGTNNGGSPAGNTSSQTYYNVCITSKAVNGKLNYSGYCFGPVQREVNTCGTGGGNFVSQQNSASTCDTAGKAWLTKN